MILFFLKNLGMSRIRMQKYPKSTSTQKVSSAGMVPFLEYLCFIGPKQEYTRKHHPKDTNGRNNSLYNSVLNTLKVEKLVSTYRS